MDLDRLAIEIGTDPRSLGYAGRSLQEVADLLNSPTQTGRKMVALWLLKRRLIETGAWLALQAAAETESQIQTAARLACEYIEDQRFENLDMDLQSTQQMIGALVAGGIVTADLAAELNTMATSQISRAEQIGLGQVTDGDVQAARERL
jgi:hypothetical protein